MPTKFISSLHGQGLYWGGSMRWGVSLIVLGILGESLLPAPVSVERVIAWLLVLAGMVHVIVAHHALRAGSLISRLMIGFAHVLFGVYLVISPVLGLASLAWVLASLFLFESILDIAIFLRLRAIKGSSWVLLDGMVTMILGLLLYRQWPSLAGWAIGVFVSTSLVTSGVTLVMLSLAARDAGSGGNRDDSSVKEYWKMHG